MKKKILPIVLIGILAVLFIAGMFLSQPLKIKIFSTAVGFVILFGLRFARIKLEPKKLHLMWGLAASDIILFSALLEGGVILSFFAVSIIYVYAPLIGQALGLNNVKGVKDWFGTMTDEGEIVGEERYYERNSLISLPIFIIFFGYFAFVALSLTT